MKMIVFWALALCGMVYIDRRFRDTASTIRAMMEAISTSETPVSLYQSTPDNTPEHSNLQEKKASFRSNISTMIRKNLHSRSTTHRFLRLVT
jgi:hypothetical protein